MTKELDKMMDNEGDKIAGEINTTLKDMGLNKNISISVDRRSKPYKFTYNIENHKEIGELNKKILFNKGLRECENCDEKISVDSIFCPSCGEKLKALRIKENKKNDKADKEEVIKQQVCPQCGKIESPDARFCPKCGYKFAK